MTAACAVMLALDGRLDLDSDVRDLVPELAVGVPVTVRQCLDHTAGLCDYLISAQLTGTSFGNLAGEREFLTALRGMTSTAFPPG
jgi:CubicO group peptidase (beta-lactamase class C family)